MAQAWRAEDCRDRSTRPHRLPWKGTEGACAVLCALWRATNFALDDLAFVVVHFLLHANRDNIWRILHAEGLSRHPPAPNEEPRRGQGTFQQYDLGFAHIDSQHLPKLPTADGERCKRYLYVASNPRSRFVYLAV